MPGNHRIYHIYLIVPRTPQPYKVPGRVSSGSPAMNVECISKRPEPDLSFHDYLFVLDRELPIEEVPLTYHLVKVDDVEGSYHFSVGLL